VTVTLLIVSLARPYSDIVASVSSIERTKALKVTRPSRRGAGLNHSTLPANRQPFWLASQVSAR
jgi:hypothetical protein